MMQAAEDLKFEYESKGRDQTRKAAAGDRFVIGLLGAWPSRRYKAHYMVCLQEIRRRCPQLCMVLPPPGC